MNPRELTPLRKLVLSDADKEIQKELKLIRENNFEMNLSEETKQLILSVADYIREV